VSHTQVRHRWSRLGYADIRSLTRSQGPPTSSGIGAARVRTASSPDSCGHHELVDSAGSQHSDGVRSCGQKLLAAGNTDDEGQSFGTLCDRNVAVSGAQRTPPHSR